MIGGGGGVGVRTIGVGGGTGSCTAIKYNYLNFLRAGSHKFTLKLTIFPL